MNTNATTITIDSVPSNSLLLAPAIDTSSPPVNTMELMYPDASPSFLQVAGASSCCFGYLQGHGGGVIHFDSLMGKKDREIERLRKNIQVATACSEVTRKISEIHKRGFTEERQKVSLLERKVLGLEQRLREAEEKKRELQQMVSGLIQKMNAMAREAMRGRRGNPIQVFPELAKSLGALCFEVLATSGQLNITTGIPGDHAIHSSITRTLRLVDDTIKLLHQIEMASREVVGDISESNPWDRKIRRAARGLRVESVKEVLDRIRGTASNAIKRPFTVSTAPILSFLGRSDASDSSMRSVHRSSGMSMSDVSGWCEGVARAGNSSVMSMESGEFRE
ncbi:hypothetical protein V5O48_014028 [Marasmius crinis-equi]|uniref:Uncharacterized protein n=1 Tax=Marasmius crinis-equi TaxID=585013 RepID=A0ABR3EYH4_9AGAR